MTSGTRSHLIERGLRDLLVDLLGEAILVKRDEIRALSSVRLLTVKEIAGRWRCSEEYVRREIRGGVLPARKISNALLVDPEALARYEAAAEIAVDEAGGAA